MSPLSFCRPLLSHLKSSQSLSVGISPFVLSYPNGWIGPFEDSLLFPFPLPWKSDVKEEVTRSHEGKKGITKRRREREREMTPFVLLLLLPHRRSLSRHSFKGKDCQWTHFKGTLRHLLRLYSSILRLSKIVEHCIEDDLSISRTEESASGLKRYSLHSLNPIFPLLSISSVEGASRLSSVHIKWWIEMEGYPSPSLPLSSLPFVERIHSICCYYSWSLPLSQSINRPYPLMVPSLFLCLLVALIDKIRWLSQNRKEW